MPDKQWSDPSIIKTLKNPSDQNYEVRHVNSELTFLGVDNQPDLGTVTIEFVPNQKIIELKSLKRYFYDFRNRVISYERFANTVYADIMAVCEPYSLIVTVTFNARGGISSTIGIDSKTR